MLLDELAEAFVDGTRKEFMESLAIVPLLIIDDFGMRKLPLTAAEDLPEIIMRRYEPAIQAGGRYRISKPGGSSFIRIVQ